MKKFSCLVLALIFSASLAFAQDTASAGYVQLQGIIIDNANADAHASDIADFIKAYTKEAALTPRYMEKGYSIYSDGRLMPFDEASSVLVADFLKEPGSRLDVEIEAQQVDYTPDLTLVKIKNQAQAKAE